MIKPLEGYVVIEIEDIKTNSGIILDAARNLSNKRAIVKAIHNEERDIKIGDDIVLLGSAEMILVKDKKDYYVVPKVGIVAIR